MSDARRKLIDRRDHYHGVSDNAEAGGGFVTMTSTASGTVTTGVLQTEYEAVCRKIRKTKDLREIYRLMGKFKAASVADTRLKDLRTRQLRLELMMSLAADDYEDSKEVYDVAI